MRRNRELLLNIHARGLHTSCSKWRRHFKFSTRRNRQRRIFCRLWLGRIVIRIR
jgi:hypothetical protein